MIIKHALREAITKLQSLENPTLEAEVLLAALLEKNRTWLKTHYHTQLSPEQVELFNAWTAQRAQHIPIAYITGQVEWSGLNLKVNQHTLIPRDETETLCHHIKAQQPNPPLQILDIGTGSGCLAIWAHTQFPESQVTALDISPEALTIARDNADNHKAAITFLESDLLAAIKTGSHFDLIMANLPYVPYQISVTPEVQKEPANAIFSADEGLSHIKRLASEIADKNHTFKQLWLEFLPSQAKAIKTIFKDYTVIFYPAVDGQYFFALVTPPA